MSLPFCELKVHDLLQSDLLQFFSTEIFTHYMYSKESNSKLIPKNKQCKNKIKLTNVVYE